MPFFSIGVTTYDRSEMLVETISSILEQSFSDFEVVVSNDNPGRTISRESLGINDPRVRFLNQDKALGARSNMNFLLNTCRGRYFTWLADDDLYKPNFLKEVHASLTNFDSPSCVFTSYTMDPLSLHEKDSLATKQQLFTGSQFLRQYLDRTLKTQGCYGIFDIEYIRKIGGMVQLGNSSFSPYADNLIAIKAGLLEKVVFINTPLIYYRAHEGSNSLTSNDFNGYFSAQIDFCSECIKIFNNEKLHDDFQHNVFCLLKWCIGDFITIFCRSGFVNLRQAILWMAFLKRSTRLLKKAGLFLKLFVFTIRSIVKDVICICRVRLRSFLIRN